MQSIPHYPYFINLLANNIYNKNTLLKSDHGTGKSNIIKHILLHSFFDECYIFGHSSHRITTSKYRNIVSHIIDFYQIHYILPRLRELPHKKIIVIIDTNWTYLKNTLRDYVFYHIDLLMNMGITFILSCDGCTRLPESIFSKFHHTIFTDMGFEPFIRDLYKETLITKYLPDFSYKNFKKFSHKLKRDHYIYSGILGVYTFHPKLFRNQKLKFYKINETLDIDTIMSKKSSDLQTFIKKYDKKYDEDENQEYILLDDRIDELLFNN